MKSSWNVTRSIVAGGTWRRRISVAGLLGMVLIVSWTTASAVLMQEQTPESLFPAETFLLGRLDGRLLHEEAYQQTAEYDAFFNSGLADLFEQTIDFFVARDESGQAETVRDAINDLLDEGFLFGAFMTGEGDLPIPAVALMLPEAGHMYEPAVEMLEQALQGQEAEFEAVVLGRTKTHRLTFPEINAEIWLWKSGNHLVVAAGQAGSNVAQIMLDSASGKRPGLNTNTRWMEISTAELDFTQSSLFWLDFKSLQETYGPIPLPLPIEEQVTVADVLKLAGLDRLDTIVARSGYKGTSLWSETSVKGIGSDPATQLSLADLPPLPVKFTSFSAMQIDVQAAYQQLIELARQVAAVAGEEQEQQLEGMLDQLPDLLGFDLEADLLEHIGNVMCFYDDVNCGVFGMGTTLAISLKDPEKVQSFLSAQMDRLEEAEENGESPDLQVYPIRIEKDGAEMLVFDFYDDNGGAVQLGGLQVIDNWLVVGVMPQAVAAFRMRIDEELPRWTADGEYADALAELPDEFTSITVVNARESYQLLLSLGTTFLPFLQKAALEEDFLQEDEELPFYVEDFPPAERITHGLYPNVSVSVADETGTRMISRGSTYGFPLPGGNGAMGSIAVASTGVALLLPAIQQAREAARRSSSMNNLKQIGLAMHNYHDVFNHFPTATVEGTKLKPDERLSWAYSLLPFLEQAALYEGIRADQKWDSDDNQLPVGSVLTFFTEPGSDKPTVDGYGAMHYAGMAGVGKDAPELPLGHERAGIFGYNRKTRMRDITDGTSNTIMVTGVNKKNGPWAQGGESTLRSLTKQPYINGPDGIGRPGDEKGVLVLFADGAVRYLSADTDPKLLEKLVKIADGESIP